MADPWYMPKAAQSDNLAAALATASALSRQLAGWKTGTLAPVERNIVTGELRPAVPMFVQDAVRGVMAPGKAIRGEYGLTATPDGRVSYDGMAEDAAALAGTVTLGAGAMPRPAGVLDMGFKAYHGTDAVFSKFDPAKIGKNDPGHLGKGFYFSTDERVAKGFPITMEADIGTENPLKVALPDFRTDKRFVVREALGLPKDATAEEVTKAAKKAGFDSVELDYSPTGYNAKEIVVFDDKKINVLSTEARR